MDPISVEKLNTLDVLLVHSAEIESVASTLSGHFATLAPHHFPIAVVLDGRSHHSHTGALRYLEIDTVVVMYTATPRRVIQWAELITIGG